MKGISTFIIAGFLIFSASFAKADCPNLPDEANVKTVLTTIHLIEADYLVEISFPNLKNLNCEKKYEEYHFEFAPEDIVRVKYTNLNTLEVTQEVEFAKLDVFFYNTSIPGFNLRAPSKALYPFRVTSIWSSPVVEEGTVLFDENRRPPEYSYYTRIQTIFYWD